MSDYRAETIHRDREKLAGYVKGFYASDLNEDVWEARLAAVLSTHFFVDRQVRSLCGKGRIDILATHKQTTDAYGIEVKNLCRKRGKDIGQWLRQVMRYQEYKWPVEVGAFLVFPQISGIYFDERLMMHNHRLMPKGTEGVGPHHNVSTFLGAAFGIGEVQFYDAGQDKLKIRFVQTAKVRWQEL